MVSWADILYNIGNFLLGIFYDIINGVVFKIPLTVVVIEIWLC